MAGKAVSSNPLVIAGRPDTSLNVQLHPLVLLTISDYITRHTVRQQQGPIVGAIIGEQNGRDFTLEHAYQCKFAGNAQDAMLDQLDEEWFSVRLDMYKEVHKVPALDLVALFMLGPVDGPQPAHLPLLKQVQRITNNDSIMLLLFHPEQVDTMSGGKLPISLYESVEELEGDQTQIRFKELAFEVETSDAEMIGVNSVATSGGNATAVPKAEMVTPEGASASQSRKIKGKGKARDEDAEGEGATSTTILSPEDDELISTLNSKVNAIKMLNERVNLIRSYLQTVPESYLTDAQSTAAPPENTNFALLRSVNSMLSRLPLLAPPTSATSEDTPGDAIPVAALQQAGEKEKQDVHLTNLLASLTRSVTEVNNLSSKFLILQREKQAKDRTPLGRGGGRFAEEDLISNGGF